ncbi:hypothetical protein PG994_000928 [Apiospora phragmitis]|uniref:Uncharacterized protein n=1 Tax=Apiospora phragmitis TaxID=2905665 RepID=A0ABR1WSC5_9PEZI
MIGRTPDGTRDTEREFLEKDEEKKDKQCLNRRANQLRQKLNFIFQLGAVIALAIRLCRFCWRHKWDLTFWVTPGIGGFVSAHAVRLAFGSDNVIDAYTCFIPWTYLGTLVVYVVFRLRQAERLPKQY